MVVALIAGALFGTGLHLSGMTDTQKVMGFLDIFGAWDPSLMFVMGAGDFADGSCMAHYRAAQCTSGWGAVSPTPQPQIDRKLVKGALLFGAGWGLAGFWPRPALASLSYGGVSGLVFLAAMLTGMTLGWRVLRWLDSSGSAS
jgi:uncharacterized membrane protein YedE/YeeE